MAMQQALQGVFLVPPNPYMDVLHPLNPYTDTVRLLPSNPVMEMQTDMYAAQEDLEDMPLDGRCCDLNPAQECRLNALALVANLMSQRDYGTQ
jgi:hypothetical protein